MPKALTEKQQRIHDMRRPVADGGEGKTRDEIARILGISPNVVGKTITVINKKLGIRDASQKANEARRIENRDPEKAAAAIDAMTDPRYDNLVEACKAAGLPQGVVNGFIRRLKLKYTGPLHEARNLQTKELSEVVGKKIDLMLAYLDEYTISQASARDLAMGITALIEKRALLRGEPTVIVSDLERKKLNQILPLLIEEGKRRGVTVDGQITERSIGPA